MRDADRLVNYALQILHRAEGLHNMAQDELVALATRFGAMGAIAFRQFDATLVDLPADARNYLRRCFVATLDVAAGDARREISLLRDALCKLRDEWKEHP